MRDFTGSRDQEDLGRFGYAQQLFRSMGGFSNFAISFSIISILTGAVTLYGYGLQMGGPLEMTLGWPLATLFTLAVAASMAEMCSAYPTSGAMYHWAADLGGPGWGWLVGWLNIIGLVAALAGINYSCAQFVLPFLGATLTEKNIFLTLVFILLNQALLNHYSVRLVAWLNDLSVAVHIAGVILLVGALFCCAPRQPASFLLTASNSNGTSPYWWAFLLGLLQAQWTFTGFDASAHLSEETADPRRRAPWGMVLSVAVSGVVGYLLLLALTLAIPSVTSVLSARDAGGQPTPAAIAILQSGLGAKAGNAMAALASMAMWFCGLSAVASASRTLFALARDHGAPLSDWLRSVNPKHGTPGPAIWTIALAALAAMAWTKAIPVVTSLSTVALYASYLTPIVLGLRRRRWQGEAVWNLGRWSRAVNVVAIGYTVLICVVLVAPPNQLAGGTFAALICLLGALYRLRVRQRYQGPEWVLRRKQGP